MAKKRARTEMETREFLAIVTESGEEILLDDEIVRKYRLRAGILSPFSSQPIISVTRRVPIVVPPSKKAGHAAPKKAGARRAAGAQRKKKAAATSAGKARRKR